VAPAPQGDADKVWSDRERDEKKTQRLQLSEDNETENERPERRTELAAEPATPGPLERLRTPVSASLHTHDFGRSVARLDAVAVA